MKIEINFSSFRFKIVATLIMVITLTSFAAFYIYNKVLSEKIYKSAEDDMVSMLYFMRNQIVSIHDGRLIKPYLQNMEGNGLGLHSHLINPEGKVLYPPGNGTLGKEKIDVSPFIVQPNDVTVKNITSDSASFSRAVIRLTNSQTCYGCHDPAQKILGFIVVDYSLRAPENTLAFTRKFSLIFTIIMIAIILSFVFILHYNIVRKSLSRFQSAINVINQGNLSERITIPKSTELGKLGKSFNEMVGRFQETQVELQRYHKRELRNSQKLATIGEMSARLAHEIRNPITGISNAVEIIIEEDSTSENRPILEEIKRQAQRVNKAVSNMLNYARSKELNLQMAEINEIIRSVIFFLRNQSAHGLMQLESRLQTDIPEFLFDPEQVENSLLNLGLNGIQACNSNGTITFTSSFDKNRQLVTIEVIDTGIGIPVDKLDEVFKPYYTTRTQGTGLGLAIVKEIVEMHEGTVGVSNNPGGGSTFAINLPVKANLQT